MIEQIFLLHHLNGLGDGGDDGGGGGNSSRHRQAYRVDSKELGGKIC
jgi:hypothetical protein